MGVTRQFSPEHIRARLNAVNQLAPATAHPQIAPEVISILMEGEMELEGLMPWSSNYTFLATIHAKNAQNILGIYKPGDGERPLWDFPDHTLSYREFASYLVSRALGWPNIPPTVLRVGPHGLGSVQLFVEAEYEAHYFNMKTLPAFTADFMQMALFDYIVNNADRKGGHCLKGRDGTVWAIDHGLTFHAAPKLRTVIWEFSDTPIPPPLLADLARLQHIVENAELDEVLAGLLLPPEIGAFTTRLARLVAAGKFPSLQPGRNVPYPPI